VEALRDAVQEPFKNLAAALSQSEGTATLHHLGEVVTAMFERLDDDPRQRGLSLVIMRLDITNASKSGESGSTFHNEMREVLQRIFVSIDRDGGLPSAWPPRKAAAALGAAVGGLVMEWALGPPDFRLSGDGADLIRAILQSWHTVA